MNSFKAQILLQHVVRTLPQDVDLRRRLLDATIEALPPSDVPDSIRELLGDLDRHISAQRELAIEVATDPALRGSGRLGDRPIKR